MNNQMIDIFNLVYKEYGFKAVLKEVEDRLTYGKVTEKENGLYRVTTGGFSEDEEIVENLMSILSEFGRNHYVGYLRGGAFYFSETKHDMNIEIVKVGE